MYDNALLALGDYFLENVDTIWTFKLLAIRFAGMMLVLPGIGGGEKGMFIRFGAILVLSFASLATSPTATLPPHLLLMIVEGGSEFLLGFGIGLIPVLIIAGVQTGAQLSATTMGLGAAQLVDPNMGVNTNSLARVIGDLGVILFLALGGHYVVIHAVSGLGGQMVPGTFLLGDLSVEMLINRTAQVFTIGAMISAPVIVALLLTQFVMGLITKAVPTVNIFIVSFPLTIGIGLVLSAVSLPDVMLYLQREFTGIENSILILTDDVRQVPVP